MTKHLKIPKSTDPHSLESVVLKAFIDPEYGYPKSHDACSLGYYLDPIWAGESVHNAAASCII
jgi:hypothetical protein